MDSDWLRIEPQNGQAGTVAIQLSVLSVNEGIDRVKRVQSVCGDTKTELVVRQSGKRETFRASDGDFILADGKTFNVLKDE